MTGAQALLRGGLHTGSVMVGTRQGAFVVRGLRPRVLLRRTVGHDLGLYWANALVAEERARALGALSDHADQLRLSWEAFEAEFRRLWPTWVDTSSTMPVRTASCAACGPTPSVTPAGEIVRRIIGFAHLTDLTTLPDPVPASRRALLLGREPIVRREELTDVEAVRAVVESLG